MLIRFTALLLAVIIGLCSLASCYPSGGDTGGNQGGEGNSQEPENLIYNSASELNLILGDNIEGNGIIDIFDSLFISRGNPVNMANDDSPKGKHEIVIGDTSRSITEEAYIIMENEAAGLDLFDKTYYLIYSDGSSLAVVFNKDEYNIAENLALECLSDKYIKNELLAERGILDFAVIDIVEEYLAPKDKERRDEVIAVIKNMVGEETAAALVSMTEIYDSRLIEWLAGLYAPSICVCIGMGDESCRNTKYCNVNGAGFYFSNSGRDTVGYLPDVESTRQALGMISSAGLCWMYGDSYKEALPKEILESIARYVQVLQSPDGYFRHPQWAHLSDYDMRLNRDLSWSTTLLGVGGLSPYYTTPNGIPGIGAPSDNKTKLTTELDISDAIAVSKVISVSTYPAVLESEESFIAFLKTMDDSIRRDSYYYGSRMQTYSAQIQVRDKTLGTVENPTPLMDILINWLNSHINPERGTWVWDEANGGNSYQMGTYAETNGVMKISGLYEVAGARWPAGVKCMEICAAMLTTSEQPTGAVDIYNAWIALGAVNNVVANHGTAEERAAASAFMQDFRQRGAAEAVLASRDKLLLFKREDGSFSYWTGASPGYSMGMPTAVIGSVEGDINGALIASADTWGFICSRLGVPKIPLFGSVELHEFKKILMNARPVTK